MEIVARKVRSMKFLLLCFIRTYRRYVSPIKGFSCAHNYVYGQGSCSDWALNVIESDGIWGFLVELPTRIRQCNAASKQVGAEEKSDGEDTREEGQIDKCCIPVEIASCWILGP